MFESTPSTRNASAADIVCARSALGQQWVHTPGEARLVEMLCQHHKISPLLAGLLVQRNVQTEQVQDFLSPTLRQALPDPFHLKDMDKAVARVIRALEANENIVIFGDYDVDGATTTALLFRYLKQVGAAVQLYVPNRMEEGYGPNVPAFEHLIDDGAQLIITVDCGTMAFAPVDAARARNIDVVIIDHHASETMLPAAVALINPNRFDETSPYKYLAACGVTFLFCVALNTRLREMGWFNNRPEPSLLQMLDLVALGTICDVMPLTGLNRAYVTQGLKVMGKWQNPGLSALAQQANIHQPPDVFHAGYILGPRINASGRIGMGALGAQLLSTDEPHEAKRIAAELHALNDTRRDFEEAAYQSALAQMATMPTPAGIICILGADWHQGVIGIVASRLKEKYNLPSLVMTILPDGTVKGSGRSLPGFDLGAAVIAARQAGLLTSGGGHPMAAGLSALPEKLTELEEFLRQQVFRATKGIADISRVHIHGHLPDLSILTTGFAQELQQLAPYGPGNLEPVFVLPRITMRKPQLFGTDHVRGFVYDAKGGNIRAAAFRHGSTELGKLLLNAQGHLIDLLVKLRFRTGYGTLELVIEDATISG